MKMIRTLYNSVTAQMKENVNETEAYDFEFIICEIAANVSLVLFHLRTL